MRQILRRAIAGSLATTIAACGSSTLPSETVSVSLTELANEVAESQFDAMAKYADVGVRLSGSVEHIVDQAEDEPVVMLTMPDGRPRAALLFADAKGALKDVQLGEEITATCRLAGSGAIVEASIMLIDCRL